VHEYLFSLCLLDVFMPSGCWYSSLVLSLLLP
jgi:hypothetical protein